MPDGYFLALGSDALAHRKAERAVLRLNKPIGGPRWVKTTGMPPVHPLMCDCRTCHVPITAADRAKWTRLGLDALTEPERVTVITSVSNEPKRRSKWRNRGKSGN